ncbi:hypothetical protein C0J52_25929 [Blattella germanica]|nr:hypothetical protein C0J52_25929 [Blattella germanica]
MRVTEEKKFGATLEAAPSARFTLLRLCEYSVGIGLSPGVQEASKMRDPVCCYDSSVAYVVRTACRRTLLRAQVVYEKMQELKDPIISNMHWGLRKPATLKRNRPCHIHETTFRNPFEQHPE